MDQTSTSSITENLIRTALKSVSYGKPAGKTLEFIRNFAAGIRIVGELPGEASAFSLN